MQAVQKLRYRMGILPMRIIDAALSRNQGKKQISRREHASSLVEQLLTGDHASRLHLTIHRIAACYHGAR